MLRAGRRRAGLIRHLRSPSRRLANPHMAAVSGGDGAPSGSAAPRPPSLGSGDSETNAALGVARDRWFHGLHAAPLPASTLAELDVYGTLATKHSRLKPEQLKRAYADARERTTRLLAGLSEEQLLGAHEPSLNPLVWVVGHCAHFYEAMVRPTVAQVFSLCFLY